MVLVLLLNRGGLMHVCQVKDLPESTSLLAKKMPDTTEYEILSGLVLPERLTNVKTAIF
jgi:hypothetical protein